MKSRPPTPRPSLAPDRTPWVLGAVALLFILFLVDVGLSLMQPREEPPPPDPGFVAATEEARSSYPDFLAAWRNPQPDQLDFRLRAPMRWEGELYHVWLVESELTETSIVGRAESIVPGEVEQVSLTPDEITDWMILRRDRTFQGGFVVRWERSQLSPEARAEWDEASGLDFSEPASEDVDDE